MPRHDPYWQRRMQAEVRAARRRDLAYLIITVACFAVAVGIVAAGFICLMLRVVE